METLALLSPGIPVYSRDRRGFIAAVEQSTARTYTLGTGAMRAVASNVTIVWEGGTISADIPNTMAEDWADEARRMGLADVPDHAERYAAARQARTDAQQAAADARRAADEARKLFEADAADKIPPGAKAVIYAELERNDSDLNTDYFGSVTERTLILGFSTHTRDLFPELRKAARNHPETAFLADAPDSAEHREKYSMGHGFYLSTGGRYSGWQVRKRSLHPTNPAGSIPSGEWSLAPASAPAAEAVPVGGFTIEKHQHSKRGFDMWIVIMPGRVEREEFDRLRSAAEALGGWYSRPWGKTPGGFAFKVEADAQAFANAEPSAPPPPDGSGQGNAAAPTSPAMGDKLRALADAMQKEIDHGNHDRLTNTPKRQREAASARMEATRWERAQRGLRALADLHDAGNVPPVLARLATKAKAYELAGSIIDRSRGGYYDAGIDTGKPYHDTPEALAFWELIGAPSDAARQAEELRRKVDSLRFANIPGYFPTPAPVVARMIEAADIPAGARILEPSAGSGAILDGVRVVHPDATMQAIERHATLCDVLRGKGYSVHAGDFFDYDAPAERFDRVLMNPPFENGQDMEHVRRAFTWLKPGGRLVAIMSPGPFFRQDRKATEFRAWFDDIGGTREDIPAGAFKESGTGIATVLIVLDKDDAPAEIATEPTPAKVDLLRTGTCHFVSIAAARAYYARQGEDAAAVLDKLAEGAIYIGPPDLKPGQALHVIADEGRYAIEEAR